MLGSPTCGLRSFLRTGGRDHGHLPSACSGHLPVPRSQLCSSLCLPLCRTPHRWANRPHPQFQPQEGRHLHRHLGACAGARLDAAAVLAVVGGRGGGAAQGRAGGPGGAAGPASGIEPRPTHRAARGGCADAVRGRGHGGRCGHARGQPRLPSRAHHADPATHRGWRGRLRGLFRGQGALLERPGHALGIAVKMDLCLQPGPRARWPRRPRRPPQLRCMGHRADADAQAGGGACARVPRRQAAGGGPGGRACSRGAANGEAIFKNPDIALLGITYQRATFTRTQTMFLWPKQARLTR
jgi:hypothetical protein